MLKNRINANLVNQNFEINSQNKYFNTFKNIKPILNQTLESKS